MKDFRPDSPFLKLLGVTSQLVVNNVLQELPASPGILEEPAFQNAVQFLQYKRGIRML